MIKKTMAILFFTVSLAGCSDNAGQNETDLKDPAEVHPPGEAIPDTTKLVNDSVIVPKDLNETDSIR